MHSSASTPHKCNYCQSGWCFSLVGINCLCSSLCGRASCVPRPCSMGSRCRCCGFTNLCAFAESVRVFWQAFVVVVFRLFAFTALLQMLNRWVFFFQFTCKGSWPLSLFSLCLTDWWASVFRTVPLVLFCSGRRYGCFGGITLSNQIALLVQSWFLWRLLWNGTDSIRTGVTGFVVFVTVTAFSVFFHDLWKVRSLLLVLILSIDRPVASQL